MRGHTSLLFFPGEAEIIKSCQLGGDNFVPLHAKLEDSKIAAARAATAFPRCICASSLGEKGTTIPDVTFALDAGVARVESDRNGIHKTIDVEVDDARAFQRMSRAGRTRPGVGVRIRRSLPAIAPTVSNLMEACILGWGSNVEKSAAFLCDNIPAGLESEARARLQQFPSIANARAVFLETPVSMLYAPALVHAKTDQYDVRAEVAWVIMLIETGALDKAKEVSICLLLGAFYHRLGSAEEKERFHMKKLSLARRRLQSYKEAANIQPCPMSIEYTSDAVTLALSNLLTALCWAHDSVAHCVGVPFKSTLASGHFVAAGFREVPWKGVVALVQLPLSDWVRAGLRRPLPLEKGVCSTDSTLEDFQFSAYLALREHKIDLTGWYAQGGAGESEVAHNMTNHCSAKWGFCFPNCNRLLRQTCPAEVAWLPELCDTIARSCSQFERSVVFIGDARLSPGARSGDVFNDHVTRYQDEVRKRGVAVVSDFSGALRGDGIHWAASEHAAVAQLLREMVKVAVSVKVTPSAAASQPSWWYYAQTEPGWYQAKCRPCGKFITDEHLASFGHRSRAQAPFTGQSSVFLCGCTANALEPHEVEIATGLALLSTPTRATSPILPPSPRSCGGCVEEVGCVMSAVAANTLEPHEVEIDTGLAPLTTPTGATSWSLPPSPRSCGGCVEEVGCDMGTVVGAPPQAVKERGACTEGRAAMAYRSNGADLASTPLLHEASDGDVPEADWGDRAMSLSPRRSADESYEAVEHCGAATSCNCAASAAQAAAEPVDSTSPAEMGTKRGRWSDEEWSDGADMNPGSTQYPTGRRASAEYHPVEASVAPAHWDYEGPMEWVYYEAASRRNEQGWHERYPIGTRGKPPGTGNKAQTDRRKKQREAKKRALQQGLR